jgi:hypothetical protein
MIFLKEERALLPDDIKEKIIKKYNIPDPEPPRNVPKEDRPKNDSEYPGITEFVIDPYVGAGVLRLGMTPAEVQKALNFNPRKYRRLHEKEDDYRICFVYYKEPEICNAIEFFPPASVLFHGKNLLDCSLKEAMEFVRQYDSDLEIEAGFISHKYGFGVYAEFGIYEPENPVETVIVFEKGYYD